MKCANTACLENATFGRGGSLGANIGWCEYHIPAEVSNELRLARQQYEAMTRLHKLQREMFDADEFAKNNPAFGI